MSSQTKPLGDWVDQVVDEVFFQPDDDVASKAYDKYFAPGLEVRINLRRFDFDGYKTIAMSARSANSLSKQTNDELLKWEDADGMSGVVGHHTNYTLKDKVTGTAYTNTHLILTTVKEVNGKRLITEITEIAT